MDHLDEAASLAKLGFSPVARNFISVFKAEPPSLDDKTLVESSSSDIGYMRFKSEEQASMAMSALLGNAFFWYWLARGDGFHVTGRVIWDFLMALHTIPEKYRGLLADLGDILNERRFEALVFKRNAGKYVGSYNYRVLSSLTNRADLLLMASLGLGRQQALEVMDYVKRVLSINAFAGEKSIPAEVKSLFSVQQTGSHFQRGLFEEIDHLLMEYYGFTDEELDFIINYDIKYRMGQEAEDGE